MTSTLFSVLGAKMHYDSQRQALLAQNVANADTPGYKAQDLQPVDFAAMLGGNSLAPVTTSPMHLSGAGIDISGAYKAMVRDKNAESDLSGNNVSLDEETKEMSLNQSDYNQAITLYHKNVTMLQTVLEVGQNS